MAAIKSPVGGPLLSVLQQIVALAHSEHSTRGLFSGMAALDENLKVTPRSSPLGRKLSTLKHNHLVYLRMLDLAVGVLDETPVTILQLPNAASPGTPNVFCQKQVWCLGRAFARIGPRARRAAPVCGTRHADDAVKAPFAGATCSTLRDALQSNDVARRRDVAMEPMQRPKLKKKFARSRLHWSSAYGRIEK
ncbi:hypothetical protein I4F81_010881 [Pyropia yezoensis]|uniref:Uncharacterized protein n=1 Tax=Pyropia yezoensis TaxID=2788 RepID=A0ACC3CF47_PYRYE|nr:hypothetical protein I4F81_010881 [Neopyropia yezoensis]